MTNLLTFRLTPVQKEYLKNCQLENRCPEYKTIAHELLGSKMKTWCAGEEVEGTVFRAYDNVLYKGKLDEQIVFLIDHSDTPVNWGGHYYKFSSQHLRKYTKDQINAFYSGKISREEILSNPQY